MAAGSQDGSCAQATIQRGLQQQQCKLPKQHATVQLLCSQYHIGYSRRGVLACRGIGRDGGLHKPIRRGGGARFAETPTPLYLFEAF
jgi:hypothetical protein